MLTYEPIDPVAINLGPVAVHWYGLMYVIGILGGWWLGRVHARRSFTPLNVQQVDDLVTWVAFGVILGGRIGSVLFYNFGEFIERPLMLFSPARNSTTSLNYASPTMESKASRSCCPPTRFGRSRDRTA